MSRIYIMLLAAVFFFAASPAHAFHRHHGGFLLGLNLGLCCGYSPSYGYDYYGAGYSTYMEPSTIVYTTPYPTTYVYPAYVQPTYVQPAYAESAYVEPAYVQPQPQAIPAGSASQPFTDSYGRTCRTFQTTLNNSPVNGTACLQPDGSWRTVGQ